MRPSEKLPRPAAVGHRLVHGGPDLLEPALIDAGVLRDELRDARCRSRRCTCPRRSLAIEAVAQRGARLPQVACFDTAFHRTLPEVARALRVAGQRVRNRACAATGFTACRTSTVVAAFAPARSARRDRPPRQRRSALRGARRALHRHDDGPHPGGRDHDGRRGPATSIPACSSSSCAGQISRSARRDSSNGESGLLGVSGITSDMQALLASRTATRAPQLAVEMFCYQACKAIGALAAALGGLDTLVFTGGIGEHATAIRERICAGLGHLGAFAVHVFPADEERVIARRVHELVPAAA